MSLGPRAANLWHFRGPRYTTRLEMRAGATANDATCCTWYRRSRPLAIGKALTAAAPLALRWIAPGAGWEYATFGYCNLESPSRPSTYRPSSRYEVEFPAKSCYSAAEHSAFHAGQQ